MISHNSDVLLKIGQTLTLSSARLKLITDGQGTDRRY